MYKLCTNFLSSCQVPTAPLEININTDTRNRLLKILLKMSQGDVNIGSGKPSTLLHSPAKSPRQDGSNHSSSTHKDRFDFHSFIDIEDKKISEKVTGVCIAVTEPSTKSPSYKYKQMHSVYTATQASQSLEIKFPDLAKLSIDEVRSVVKEYFTAFDECFEVISDIIAGDVWPRFRKSNLYEVTFREHKDKYRPYLA